MAMIPPGMSVRHWIMNLQPEKDLTLPLDEDEPSYERELFLKNFFLGGIQGQPDWEEEEQEEILDEAQHLLV